MKKALIILTILFAMLAAWIVAFPQKNPFKNLFSKDSQPDNTPDKTPVVTSPQPINTGSQSPGSFLPQTPIQQNLLGFPLMQGSTGVYVRNMQAGLNDRFGSDLVLDGIFGTKTYKAVSSHGFNADAVSYSEYKQIVGEL